MGVADPSITLENVSFSFPIRMSMGSRIRASEQPLDSRISCDRAGRARGFLALDNISLNLQTGDRLAVIGRNGSGKSTLLRLLHGVYFPSQGKMEVVGLTDALFELNLGIQPLATGYENIVYGGLMRGFNRAEIKDRMPDIAAFSELHEFLHLPMSTYSAGMRMRLLFSIATAFEPEILLLDEWIGAGDAQFRHKASERMKQHVDKAGILVLASHSAALLRSNCTKALWLERGRVVEYGELEPVFNAFDRVIQRGETKYVIDSDEREFDSDSSA